MNKLLLIQPPRSREKLTAALELAGVSYTQHSFIQITEVASSITDLTTADAIIWVSKNAVMFAKAQRLQLPDKVAMYAVGPSTARLASKQFNKPCECPTFVHSSEALLKLPELQQLTNQQWFIVKGIGGRTLLPDTLTARGANITDVMVYQRTKKPLKDTAIVQDWKQHIDTIAISSAEQLAFFISELDHNALAWLERCHWIVPSERLAALLPFCKADNITITQSASENAMINALINNGSNYD
ncbi:uroporphyrinogen-III synthase [Idiomarina sp.]|uniref:uroporphyrinogen-III synthase n=1 Tax=Idiomarina sp. TaxID=1874361 RepID=UPI0025C67011|nr:uroporphyrinogen-III synthase [Idiomarina sp.]